MHEGHRARMYAKFLMNRNLPDHEILEMLLFAVIKRRNTNEIAHRLMERFKTLYGVMAAGEEELLSVKGVGVETAKFLNVLGSFSLTHKAKISPPSFYSGAEFWNVIKARYDGVPGNFLDVYILNESDFIIDRKTFISPGQSHFEIKAKSVLEFIVAVKSARGVVMTYNHNEGSSAVPTDEEDFFVLECYAVLVNYGIRLKDFYIFCDGRIYSYCSCGGIERVKNSLRRLNKI